MFSGHVTRPLLQFCPTLAAGSSVVLVDARSNIGNFAELTLKNWCIEAKGELWWMETDAGTCWFLGIECAAQGLDGGWVATIRDHFNVGGDDRGPLMM